MENTGTIIYNQLKALGKMDLWAWGSRNFKVFTNDFFTTELNHLGGLVFKVNGLLHKQQVMIRLQCNDTYRIEIGQITKGTWKVKKGSEAITDVYFDQMIDTIDDLVEGTKKLSRADAMNVYKESESSTI